MVDEHAGSKLLVELKDALLGDFAFKVVLEGVPLIVPAENP